MANVTEESALGIAVGQGLVGSNLLGTCMYVGEAAVAEWLSSWLAEQEDQGSIPDLATWIVRDWLSPASKS